MTSVAWAGALWLIVYFRIRRPDAREGENRLLFALAVSLIATSAIATGSADDIVRDPVVVERALRGALSGVALLIALPVLIRHFETILSRRLPTFTTLFLYALVVGVSSLYSVAPLVTAGKTFEFGVGLLIVFGIVTLDEALDAIRTAIKMLLAVMGVKVGVALVGFVALPAQFSSPDSRPGFIIERTLSSPYSGSNGLAFSGAVFASFCLALLLQTTEFRRRALLASGVAVGLGGVVITSGRQGIVILIASVLSIILIVSPLRSVVFLLPLGTVVVAFGDVLLETFARGQSDQLLLSLSGRTFWWTSAVAAWIEQPLMGYGYGAGGRFVALQRVGAGGVSSVHSGYLEALVGVGLLGFVPLVIVAVRIAIASMRISLKEIEFGFLIVPLLLHTFISLGFGGWWSSDLALLALLAGFVDLWRPPKGQPQTISTPVGSARARSPGPGGLSPSGHDL